MTDQSPNDQFHASSFMQGANAAYLEQLYAQYAQNPDAVDEGWRRFFAELGDPANEAVAEAQGPSWSRTDWPPQPEDDWTNALTGEWPAVAAEVKEAGRKIKDKAAEKGRPPQRRADPARRARLDPGAHADPRLPDPGAPRCRSRPAGHARPDPASRARSEILRLHRGRHGSAHLPRQTCWGFSMGRSGRSSTS